MYVKVRGTWELVCRVEAAAHADALRVAGACLRAEHDDLPIRFQQEPRAGPRGPLRPPARQRKR